MYEVKVWIGILIGLSIVVLIASCQHKKDDLSVNISEDRACQLDNTGISHIKAWGVCPNKSATCLLRWRLAGSSMPWTDTGSTARIRSESRNPPDSELEYMGFCR